MERRVLTALCAVAIAAAAQLQIRPPGGQLPKLPVPSLESLTKGEPPLATTTSDAPGPGWPEFAETPFDDPVRLTGAHRGPDGAYRLAPGRYTLAVHSFCGQGYSHGPSKGMGYVAAAWRGSQAKLLQTLVRRYGERGDVDQKDLQTLVWAVLARTKPQDLKGRPRETLLKLMGEEGVKLMAQGALESVAEQALGRLLRQADPALRPLLEYENRVRAMFRQGTATYEGLERLAVLPPREDLRSEVPAGAWQLDPQGFLLRYRPRNYWWLEIDVVVPRKMTKVRDGQGRIAALTWADGLRVDLAYAPQPPVPVPGNPATVAHALTKVAVTAPSGETVIRQGPFFILSRRPAGLLAAHGPRPASLLDAVQDETPVITIDLEEIAKSEARTRVIGERAETYRNWWSRFWRLGRGERPDDDLVEGAHIYEMGKSVFGSREDRIGVIADTHGRLIEHLADATRTLETMGTGEGPEGGPVVVLDPPGYVAAPGNGRSQRLLPSSRPAS